MTKNEKYIPRKGDTLIIIDVQNDFLPGGSLALPDREKVIPVLNHYIYHFKKTSLPIWATQDWHPENHSSFAGYGGEWPPHCIAEKKGAAFPKELLLPASAPIISKTSLDKDSYSNIEDTDLDEQLRRLYILRLFIGGLATNYCVLHIVLDGGEIRLVDFSVNQCHKNSRCTSERWC